MGFVLLAVVGGLVWLAHASFVTIRTISVRGLQTLSSTTVIAFADARLGGSYAFVLPKRNIFLYPKAEIRNALLTQFPILKNVDVHAQNFQALEIAVVERQPRALWCGA
jgi:cell division septal protein FtsQ